MVYMEKMAEPPHSRRCRQLPSRGAEKPLLEERCHEVTEWWQKCNKKDFTKVKSDVTPKS